MFGWAEYDPVLQMGWNWFKLVLIWYFCPITFIENLFCAQSEHASVMHFQHILSTTFHSFHNIYNVSISDGRSVEKTAVIEQEVTTPRFSLTPVVKHAHCYTRVKKYSF